MTIEDFAHRCLLIKAGNAELAIPCCANCEHYNIAAGTISKYYCYNGYPHKNGAINRNPEDFCSRFEERNN